MTQNKFATKQAASTSPWEVEERLMVNMISRVNDPVVARVFLEKVQMYPDLHLQFLGACMTAEETLQREANRYAKAHELGLAAAQAQRVAVSFLSGSWNALCKLVRIALAAYKWHEARKSAKAESTSGKVVQLSIAYKATGTYD